MSTRRALPKEKLQKIVLAGIVVVAGVAALYLFWISPNLTLLAGSRDRITKLEDEIQAAQRKAKLEVANQPMLQQIQDFVAPLRERAVTGDAYMWVVLQINEMLERRPVRVPTPRPGGRDAHARVAGHEMLATTLDVEGDYDQIGILIRDFENRYPLGEVRSVDMTPVGGGPLRRATLEVRFLVWPEDKLQIKMEDEKKP